MFGDAKLPTELQGVNLAGAYLSKRDLTRHDLIGANLTGANLAGEAHMLQNSSLDEEEANVDVLVSSHWPSMLSSSMKQEEKSMLIAPVRQRVNY